MNCGRRAVYPIISSVQKMALYETKSRFYLVGSNNTQTKFRVLKIDRTEPRELVISDDKVEYTQKEIRDLLMMIDVGNRSKNSQKGNRGLSRTVSAFGIVGFVRFLEGYYIILMTKRRRVAIIGYHTIYKIEDTSMIYIPHDNVRVAHRDESRYVKMFQNVDLSSNFYFSYSYDLSHTLQYNLIVPHVLLKSCPVTDSSFEVIDECNKTLPVWNPHKTAINSLKSKTIEVAENFLDSLQTNGRSKFYSDGKELPIPVILWSELRKSHSRRQSSASQGTIDDEYEYGIRTHPQKKFVWNDYLLRNVKKQLHNDWKVYIIHGFVGQSNVAIFGKPIYLTLIARRSARFAGTRFLKRGANCDGDVANEVETEQIVHDSSVSSRMSGNFTSYVQMRGSIPSVWSQDISKMVPKPPIMFNLSDPFCHIAGMHFNDLLRRYGAPIIVLNLVKKREKKKHESILSDDYGKSIDYLNTFLPPAMAIQQIDFDMARISKLKEVSVLQKLSDISYKALKKTGIFQSRRPFYCQKLRSDPSCSGMQGYGTSNETVNQTGIVRVNCVDCLDRTNTAQFAMGKCALSFQLYALGVLEKPELDLDTDCIKMLEELYEDHGDTLALQYGGSQLVHRIKSYRKIAPMSSNTRDIMQTLSRYYSNAFSDADKQNAMNLFLGVFVPEEGKVNLWDLTTDYYLHNSCTVGRMLCHRKLYTKWWDDVVAISLPHPVDEVTNEVKPMEVIKTHQGDMRIDTFFERYRPYEFSVLGDLFEFNIGNSIRDFMPVNTMNFSPFAVRAYSNKRLHPVERNPSVSGASSTGSAASSNSSSGSEDDSDVEPDILSDTDMATPDSPKPAVSFKKMFPTMKKTYGVELKKPSRTDMLMYKKFSIIGQHTLCQMDRMSQANKQNLSVIQQSVFPMDSLFHVTPPTVSRRNKDIYCDFIRKGELRSQFLPSSSYSCYKNYVQSLSF